MQQFPLSQALHRFKPMAEDAWEYRGDLEGLARYLCRHPETGEGVARTARLRPVASVVAIYGKESVKVWLHQITGIETRLLRRRSRSGPLDVYLDSVVAGQIPDEWRDSDELSIEVKTRREILDVLAALPGNYLFALLLKEGQGLPVREIGRLMGTTPASVRSVLYRARRSIRGQLDL
jgi:DNA-directed RNA polymerase specialized sigma24 family protein